MGFNIYIEGIDDKGNTKELFDFEQHEVHDYFEEEYGFKVNTVYNLANSTDRLCEILIDLHDHIDDLLRTYQLNEKETDRYDTLIHIIQMFIVAKAKNQTEECTNITYYADV